MSPDPKRDCLKHGRLKRNCAECAQDEEITELREKVQSLKDALKKAAESFRAIHVTHGPRWSGNWRESVEKDENDCLIAIGLEPRQPIRSLRDGYKMAKRVQAFFADSDEGES